MGGIGYKWWTIIIMRTGGGGIRVIWGKYLFIADIFGVSNIERERAGEMGT